MRKWLAFCAAGMLALGAVACGSDDEKDSTSGGGSSGGGDLKGSIRIDGSSTVQPFAEAAAELFNEENPNVRITVGGAGTGDGFEKFCRGETQISDASRAIEADEEKLCSAKGITPQEVQVASDGVTIATNKDFKVDCLTTDQLKGVFGKGAKAKSLSSVPGVGILRSGKFSSLRRGFWVVFAGQFDTLKLAQDAAKSAQSGAPGAYAKKVTPK